ncbi:winged helix-turn-helix domain-containing protein [Paenibacillus aurantiacus]|uniref:Winged helix-turn-helix domain-containing protein n=1 Tax=Paenibacillus aurantiacus TaxID=1936118 RepID=A0ABV5KGW9_9BACL
MMPGGLSWTEQPGPTGAASGGTDAGESAAASETMNGPASEPSAPFGASGQPGIREAGGPTPYGTTGEAPGLRMDPASQGSGASDSPLNASAAWAADPNSAAIPREPSAGLSAAEFGHSRAGTGLSDSAAPAAPPAASGSHSAPAAANGRHELMAGPFRLSAAQRRLWKHGEEVVLTPTEWTLMKLLMEREGEGLSRDDILSAVWGRHFIGDLKIVDVNIRRIRQKIEDNPSHPVYIETLWGFGYRFNRGGA